MASIPPEWQTWIEAHLAASEKPLIAIIGPTASGKTSLSLAIAGFLQESLGKTGEIINADSRQLYTHLSIGTAKATEDERSRAPHHLVDVLHPLDDISAARYKRMAEDAVRSVQERGNIPILVGGSMLFVAAVTDGLMFAPLATPEIRSGLEKEYDVDEGISLYAELMASDPETARAFHRRNRPYLIRALEILRTTGKKPSSMKKANPEFDVLMIGVTQEREELYERIALRVKKMFDDGWLEEVEWLLEEGFPEECPAMKSLGYQDIIAYVHGKRPLTLDELMETIVHKTKRYAKRQMTWWRPDTRIHWVTGKEAVEKPNYVSILV